MRSRNDIIKVTQVSWCKSLRHYSKVLTVMIPGLPLSPGLLRCRTMTSSTSIRMWFDALQSYVEYELLKKQYKYIILFKKFK